jgi:hypothetical protein
MLGNLSVLPLTNCLWVLRVVYHIRREREKKTLCLLDGLDGDDGDGNGIDVALCLLDGTDGMVVVRLERFFLPLCVSIPLLCWEILSIQMGLALCKGDMSYCGDLLCGL